MRMCLGLRGIVSLLALVSVSASAEYPDRPVRVIVPFAPGGPTDICARIVATPLSKVLGQPMVIENKPGAEGAIGGVTLATAAPDGYTLSVSTSGAIAAVPALRKDPPYDPLVDFTPITLIGNFEFFLFMHPQVPAKTLSELVSHARANPGKLNYGTGSSGGIVATGQFLTLAGLQMVHVPYKGEAPAFSDLMTGTVQLMFATPTGAILSAVKNGTLRALVTTLDSRSTHLPEVPIASEVGMPNLSVVPFVAIYGPAKLPRQITERLSREVADLLTRPDIREQLERQTVQAKGSTPEWLAERVKSQAEIYKRGIRNAGMALN